MRIRAVVVVLVVVLAGCSGVFGGSNQSTATVTPTAVPTDQPTATPTPQYPPGVTAKGISHAKVLINARMSSVRNRSFTRRSNTTFINSNGTDPIRLSRTLRVGPPLSNNSSATLEYNETSLPSEPGMPVRRQRWTNGKRSFAKQMFLNGTTTYGHALFSDPRRRVTTGRLTSLIIDSNNSTTKVVERFAHNGTSFTRVRGHTPGGFRNTTFSLLVDSRGFIHEYTRVRHFPADANTSKTVRKVRFVGVNATDVKRPAWVETAMNRTTSMTTIKTTEGV